jgi:hypothetical protein
VETRDEHRVGKGSVPAGRVGVFWVHKARLLADSMPLAEGIDDGDFVNGSEGHVAVWPRVRGRWRATFPELAHAEYEHVPRGRVLYDRSKGRYRVFLDRQLLAVSVKRQIREAFQLPPAQTLFETDLHYTTDPRRLNALFDD